MFQSWPQNTLLYRLLCDSQGRSVTFETREHICLRMLHVEYLKSVIFLVRDFCVINSGRPVHGVRNRISLEVFIIYSEIVIRGSGGNIASSLDIRYWVYPVWKHRHPGSSACCNKKTLHYYKNKKNLINRRTQDVIKRIWIILQQHDYFIYLFCLLFHI